MFEHGQGIALRSMPIVPQSAWPRFVAPVSVRIGSACPFLLCADRALISGTRR
jgi:hypothetical protein